MVDKLDAIAVQLVLGGACHHMQIAGRIVDKVRIFGISVVQFVALAGVPFDEAVLCVCWFFVPDVCVV